MRVVFNAISYVIPSAAIALPLWATWRWDLPVPVALTFVALVWAYSLGLVVAAWNTSREDESTKDVRLERGIVQSITHSSHDSAEIQILVGDVTQAFAAAEGALAYLAPSDCVIFAYVRQTREIIRLTTIDVSTPNRIAHGGRWKRAGKPELSGIGWRRLLTREDLYSHAWFAALVPGQLGALSIMILGSSAWDWGWPAWIFLPLTGIWLILFFIFSSIWHDYESMAKMELDIGYVADETHRHSDETGGYQNIVIADTSARDGLDQRKYQRFSEEQSFAVQVGEPVMLSTDANGRILDLRNESRPALDQPGATARIRLQKREEELQKELEDRPRQWAEELSDRLQQWAEELVQSFRDGLGIGARILRQNPLPSEATLTEDQLYDEGLAETWFEIAEGPIRWIHTSDEFSGVFGLFGVLYIPDPRIHVKGGEIMYHLGGRALRCGV